MVRLMPLTAAAMTLGVPQSWLKRQADANRVPHLRIAGRILFDVRAVSEILAELAAKQMVEPLVQPDGDMPCPLS